MQPADAFDEFYKSTRTALLQQTFALTGDLPASRGAVRDAFVAAWHHWRKVSRLEDQGGWVRPLAWRHAQRRHSARIFHRDRKLDPGIRATLDALAKLPLSQRKVLLLTHLTDVSMPDIAREVGLRCTTPSSGCSWPPPSSPCSARCRRRASGRCSNRCATTSPTRAGRASPSSGAPAPPDAERTPPSAPSPSWAPSCWAVRPSRTRRASSRPSRTPAPTAWPPCASAPGSEAPQASAAAAGAVLVSVAAEDLVSLDQLTAQVPGRWRQAGTGGSQTGILMPCQSTRFADPEGTSSAVQQFKAPARKGQSRRSMVQSVEMSTTNRSAKAAYAVMLGWFGGCTDARVQLLSTYDVGAVGDAATLVVLRSWKRPETTMVAGVARTGRASTVMFTRAQDTDRPALTAAARLLADAVNGLCRLPETGPCAEKPEVVPAPPVPAGDVPSMLSEVDLPPVVGIDRPWIGTEARVARANLAASRCDLTRFDVKGMRRNMTRTFVIPEAPLSDLFGLTETVGLLPAKQAGSFIDGVRTRLRTCADRELGTDVVRVADVSTKQQDLTVWHVTTEISDDESVTYLMGIARDGGSVAQVGFVPDGKVQMAPGAFVSLVRRALDRLPALAT